MGILSRLFRRAKGSKGSRPVREDRLILFPAVDSKENYLAAFWRWVELLAANDYQRALESLSWPNGTTFTAVTLNDRITTFFGGDQPWSVVIPNDRLIAVIDDAADIKLRDDDEFGWILAHVPLTTEPGDPKRDDLPLMGLGTSFLVRPRDDQYVLEFEIFHA